MGPLKLLRHLVVILLLFLSLKGKAKTLFFNIKTLKRTLIQVLVEKILIIFFQYMKVKKVMHIV